MIFQRLALRSLKPLWYRLFGMGLLALSTVLAAWLVACGSIGSEVENEQLAGRVFDKNGKAIVQAKVSVYTVDHIPGGSLTKVGKSDRATILVWQTQTDARGNYRLDSIPRGQYNILISKDSLRSFRDSVFIAPGKNSQPSDTLRTAYKFSGTVQMQGNHDPRTVTVQVLGTDIFSNVDMLGNFTLKDLAVGQYRLRIVTTTQEYTPLYQEITVTTSSSTSIPPTLFKPTFTGIPLVTGLTAQYDSLTGIVHLKWDSVSYSQFSGFALYRDQAGSVQLSNTSLNTIRIIKQKYDDTLRFSSASDFDQNWEYRVVVIPKSGPPFGVANEVVTISAASPFKRLGKVTLTQLPNIPGGLPYQVGDTAKIVAHWFAGSTSTRFLQWNLRDMQQPDSVWVLRNLKLASVQGNDTLALPIVKPVRYFLSIDVIDSFGHVIHDSSGIQINTDSTLYNPNPPVDTLIQVDTTVFNPNPPVDTTSRLTDSIP